MSEEDKSSKTLDASEQKLRKAREDGDTWSSKEGGHLMCYLSLLVLAAVIIPLFAVPAMNTLGHFLSTAGQMNIDEPFGLQKVLGQWTRAVSVVLFPAFGVMICLAIVSIAMSGPLVASLKRLEPKMSKINPLSGFKRIFSGTNLVEFAKSLAKLLCLGLLFFWASQAAIFTLLPGSVMLPEKVLAYTGSAVVTGLANVCAAMLPFVILDIFWKRFQWLKKQKMSIKDMKDETRDSDGDPQVRAKRQMIRLKNSRRALKKAVPEATVVVMNPTHYAVALRYERGVDYAPVCVAKGLDQVALTIRALALEHEVPVIESPPLARALHAVAEEDKPIPEAHWAAVAEIVGYVLDLRKRVRRKLPSGTRHLES